MILVVGAGVFGTTAALALRRRGHAVTLLDPGSLPEPNGLCSSLDVSRAVRMDYGDDLQHQGMAAEALAIWREDWRQRWGVDAFAETGILFASAAPMEEPGFEGRTFRALQKQGVPVVRLDRQELARRFPGWRHAPWVDGYFNPQAGVARPDVALPGLLRDAQAEGVILRGEQSVESILERSGRAVGVRCADGSEVHGERVLVCAGAWTARLLPEMAPVLRPNAQTVLFLMPADPAPWMGHPFWGWDIGGSGWYGFPATEDGRVKVGHHGVGRHQEPDDRSPDEGLEGRLRAFFGDVLPDLAAAPCAETKVCFYNDSVDGDFWICPLPERENLFVATGGSGHGFKFAPVLGDLIADLVEEKDNPRLARYRWREIDGERREEARARADFPE